MQIIVTADDFGRSSSVNAAVMRAHRQGILTGASLMVAGEAFEEAVALARQAPTLAVGLHLVVVAGKACLPPEQIPLLVDGRGNFSRDPFRAGWRYFFDPAARRQLAREMAAQFEAFAATGLPLAHVDGHLHMHLHPTVFDLLLPLAERYGACGLRLPRDDLALALACDRRRAGQKLAWALAFALLCRRGRKALRGRRLAATERVYGLMQSGRMEEAYVLRALRRLKARSAELYFHPSLEAEGGSLGPNPGDLATLLSPAVRRMVSERGLRLVSYPALRRDER